MPPALDEEPTISLDTTLDIDEDEVKELIESVKEAQYFDVASMAPLTPASLVCTTYHCVYDAE